ncbi:Isopentenyldiphosphate isomerase [Pustulibacterium marinum]|uniref:Isopentenyldiphosphate isomerase n=1 Tax=Pustulibacterium marinum TaxID=1224947 RepID=A0A1I7INU1_9FLAO|nr:NUDIX domain-containing protein [Pustulibacterium marinum]SFU74599.1 Isopentenyldiphosphate isomerase [Pustulibacterium marinum]
MEEFVDILDVHGNYTGKTCSKAHAHLNGYFHPTAHIWFYTKNGEILIQKRAYNKDTFPGLWDISVAGHISAGESLETGALREIQEEIGLHIHKEELRKIGVFKKEHQFSEKFIDAEFNHIYIAELKVSFESLSRQIEEVEALKLFPIKEFETIINSNDYQEFVPHPKTYYLHVINHLKEAINS